MRALVSSFCCCCCVVHFNFQRVQIFWLSYSLLAICVVYKRFSYISKFNVSLFLSLPLPSSSSLPPSVSVCLSVCALPPPPPTSRFLFSRHEIKSLHGLRLMKANGEQTNGAVSTPVHQHGALCKQDVSTRVLPTDPGPLSLVQEVSKKMLLAPLTLSGPFPYFRFLFLFCAFLCLTALLSVGWIGLLWRKSPVVHIDQWQKKCMANIDHWWVLWYTDRWRNRSVYT